MAVSSRIAELENRYVELLEEKIGRLLKDKTAGKDEKPSSLSRKNSTSSTTAVNGDAPNPSKVTSADGSVIAESGAPQRVRFRDRKYNKAGFVEEVDGTPTIKEGKERPETTAHAFTVSRTFDREGKYDYSVITIDDDGLRALLLYALAHHPWLRHSTTTLAFTSLYEPIVHNWSLLSDIAHGEPTNPTLVELHKEIENKDADVAGTPSGALVTLKAVGTLEKSVVDLRLLLDEVRRTPGLEAYFKTTREMQEKTKSITFEYLWTIFPPGELVYSSSTFMDRPQAFIVKYCADNYTKKGANGSNWVLECWTYDWNGTSFSRVPVEFLFEDFKNTKSITSLICYPLKFLRDTLDDASSENGLIPGEVIKQKLIKRGERYRDLCLMKKGQQIFDYEGDLMARGTGVRKNTTIHHDDDTDLRSSSSLTSSREQTERIPEPPSRKQKIKKDRVMIDFGSYIQHGPEFNKYPPMGDVSFVLQEYDDDACKCGICSANVKLRENQKPHYDNVTTGNGWEKMQLLICPPRLLGYHLKEKRWVELDVENVQKIEQLRDESSFDQLQLNHRQKILIKNLVKYHVSGAETTSRAMNDLSQGKGNGLVVLLHGPPGVGKTLTAESVAKWSGKPLFAISVSDVGLDPQDVERNLQTLFELAATWRAVMLFDEADVFLESRSNNTANLERNALVSALLRALEIYDGILILTTNRLKFFDHAVQSRVNFAIRYKDLDDRQKRAIFLNFIRQLTDDNTYDKQELESWIGSDGQLESGESPFESLNGRQIRNVLFSAASIAQNDSDKRLKLTHIQQILKETTNFVKDMEYMVQIARGEAEVSYKK